MNTRIQTPENLAMARRRKRAIKDPTAGKRVENFRKRLAAVGMKRFEIQVPEDFTRAESALLRKWMPEIIEDVRNAIANPQTDESEE